MNETVDLNKKKKNPKFFCIRFWFFQKNKNKNYIDSAKFLSISIHKSQI